MCLAIGPCQQSGTYHVNCNAMSACQQSGPHHVNCNATSAVQTSAHFQVISPAYPESFSQCHSLPGLVRWLVLLTWTDRTRQERVTALKGPQSGNEKYIRQKNQ
ncbi:hypothetical protein DPMN_189684 [Dreissena polymorpha]|uniref:Uncharacterized protein n=1 Tax=Dreissena polymorpha TaxID=45954 RepID=A0A9D4ICK9_DREPO|nr:hypothetical protein DPMN_189684 [Dreissena polymorpha]